MVLPDKFIFSMSRVSKVVPPKRTILKDISLHFFPGAKIGVLGLNGSGKSTLLRIMAGVDQDFEGDAHPQPGTKIGYLPQEPVLDESKTVRETVEEAVGEVKHALKRLDEVYNEYAMEDADFDALAKEQGELEALIQAKDGHNLENALERAANALRLPEWDQKLRTYQVVNAAVWLFVACYFLSQTCYCLIYMTCIEKVSGYIGLDDY